MKRRNAHAKTGGGRVSQVESKYKSRSPQPEWLVNVGMGSEDKMKLEGLQGTDHTGPEAIAGVWIYPTHNRWRWKVLSR